ncbi:MAG: NADP-dependent isocitrate dehydrogenase, partial [Deltaproteobacteria bacterium]|nr:NADP-dependent isocitrate dehydrogenase [Deltaproteobacteria bacterium]
VYVQVNDQEKQLAFKFDSPGIFLGIHNTLESIEGFARSVFNYSLLRGLDCYFSTKNTILKTYDGFFKDTFERVFNEEFASKFEQKKLHYEHRLIDDMVAVVLRSHGGFVWALKNYDGDVQSDMVAQGFGSLGLMTSVLLSPDGQVVETEAAHGTVTRHFRLWQKGEQVSTNPIASIFAWTQGLYYRGQFDGNVSLMDQAKKLENAVKRAVENGYYTKDLAVLIEGNDTKNYLTTKDFISRVRKLFEETW